jgi:hypothetical protein
MNGKNIKLGKFGKDAIKRRNATYVKIGLWLKFDLVSNIDTW